MKIGLVCPYNIQKGGGVQEVVLESHAELKARGHDVKIITPRPNGSDDSGSPDILYLGSARDVRSPLATTAQISYKVSAGAAEQMLDDQAFDILHFHEPWVPMMSRQLLTHSSAVNVGTFHARLPDTLMSKTVEAIITPYTRPLLDYLHSFTAVSNAAAEYVKTLTDRPIEIIPNGINLQKYQTTSPPKKKKATILYVGRLEKRKGVKYLIYAFATLQRAMPKAKLVIVGDGPDRAKLEEKVRDFGIDNVEFKGYIEESEKLKLMREASVFCSPALYGESFGIVLLEAMAAGTPIVAGHNPGYESVMQGRGKLSLVNPKSTRDFARRLQLFIEDDDMRALWHEWANDYVQNFDYPTVVNNYEKLYARLVREAKT